MSDAIISVENLGKCYRLQHQQERQRYVALRDVITSKAQGLFGNRQSVVGNQQSEEEFWALKDVSFEIKQGEVVGIIGRNGAGKSTLLKILSRITEPTCGRITLRGRVASLLEVGTGFHPELTGRENVFLNGAILGMTRAETRAKFDEIVAFAGVERFLDTPVKRYSSGMYVRLAFAVAAHLEPEILVVDEVLAVGDTEFQKKCLGKINQVATSEGRTVLFVSHQLGFIREICHSAICLERSRVLYTGPASDVIEKYLTRSMAADVSAHSNARYLDKVSAFNGQPRADVFFGEVLDTIIGLQNLPDVTIGANVSIRNHLGRRLCLFSTNPHDGIILPRKADLKIRFRLDPCCLAPGAYVMDVAVTEPGIRILEEIENAFHFEVHPKPIGGTWAYEARFGDCFPPHHWQIQPALEAVPSQR